MEIYYYSELLLSIKIFTNNFVFHNKKNVYNEQKKCVSISKSIFFYYITIFKRIHKQLYNIAPK